VAVDNRCDESTSSSVRTDEKTLRAAKTSSARSVSRCAPSSLEPVFERAAGYLLRRWICCEDSEPRMQARATGHCVHPSFFRAFSCLFRVRAAFAAASLRARAAFASSPSASPPAKLIDERAFGVTLFSRASANSSRALSTTPSTCILTACSSVLLKP